MFEGYIFCTTMKYFPYLQEIFSTFVSFTDQRFLCNKPMCHIFSPEAGNHGDYWGVGRHHLYTCLHSHTQTLKLWIDKPKYQFNSPQKKLCNKSYVYPILPFSIIGLADICLNGWFTTTNGGIYLGDLDEGNFPSRQITFDATKYFLQILAEIKARMPFFAIRCSQVHSPVVIFDNVVIGSPLCEALCAC